MEITCQRTRCVVLGSVLQLSTSIPATLLAQGGHSPQTPGAGLAGGWQVPTGLRASPRLYTSMAVPVTQSRRQAGKHPAWKSAFPSPHCRAGSSAARRFQQPGWFLQEKSCFWTQG